MNIVQRNVGPMLLNKLATSPVVYLNGPRQAGKSTLVQHLATTDFPAEYLTFDNATQMAAAGSAPESFLRQRQGPLIIDEAQLVPEIFRSLKTIVDELRQQQTKVKGRFLLTGSANVMALPKLSNPLVGRMSVQTLYPLAGCEAMNNQSTFVDSLFNNDFTTTQNQVPLVELISKATFPEISDDQLMPDEWFEGYLTTILQRDVRALAEIKKLSALPHLLRILASRAGGLINDADIARSSGLNPVTSRNYKTILKMLFLSFEVEPWFRNIGKRLVKSPKGYIIDTLLLCHLLGQNLNDVEQKRPDLFGHIFENFIATELLKLLSFHKKKHQLYHFRTGNNKEVDFVIEKPDGTLAGIEVKQRDRADSRDFKGLKELAKLAGTDFIAGVVLYRGNDIVPFGDNLWAVPVDQLWH